MMVLLTHDDANHFKTQNGNIYYAMYEKRFGSGHPVISRGPTARCSAALR